MSRTARNRISLAIGLPLVVAVSLACIRIADSVADWWERPRDVAAISPLRLEIHMVHEGRLDYRGVEWQRGGQRRMEGE